MSERLTSHRRVGGAERRANGFRFGELRPWELRTSKEGEERWIGIRRAEPRSFFPCRFF